MAKSSARRWSVGIQAALILYWMVRLRDTSSYYMIYLLLGAAGIYCLSRDEGFLRTDRPGWEKVLLAAFAVLMTLMTVLANYELLDETAMNMGSPAVWRVQGGAAMGSPVFWCAVYWLLTLAGGLALFYHLTSFLAARLRDFFWADAPAGRLRSPAAVFFGAMALFAALDLAVLFLTSYPGIVSVDGYSQMLQSASGGYANHHPFYHTLFIKAAMVLGLALYDSWSAGIAIYSIFQALVMSACFAYAVVTLWQMRLPGWTVVLCFLWYLLMPYHFVFSITMWKDVPFAGMTLLFITALFRLLYRVGRRRWPALVLLTLGGMGMCLFRSNGLPAFALTALVFAVLFGRKQRLAALLMVCVVIVSAVLKYPVLERLDVAQPDMVESLSIPVQQIARVVTDCNDLTKEERELLSHVVDVDAIAETYSDYISDPIKELVRNTGDQDYLAGHKGEYLGLWFRLLMRHPVTYVKAWIDQTKGYWNGGYSYWIYWKGIVPNVFRVQATVRSEAAAAALDTYLQLSQRSPLLQPFVSIGLHVWLTLGLAVLGLLRRSQAAILTVPVLAVVATLLIATPVFCEFRYAYAVFTSLPVILAASFYRGREPG